MDFEEARESISALAAAVEVESGLPRRNEATTRLQIIDQGLGWNRTDCLAEERLDGLITDYTLMAPQQFPGRWNSGGKRAILRIVFVNEDLLVGRRFWRPGRIGVAVWAKFGDRGVPGRTGQDR